MVKKLIYLLAFIIMHSSLLFAQDDYEYDTVLIEEGVRADVYQQEDEFSQGYFEPKKEAKKISERTIEEEKIQSIKSEDAYWYADMDMKRKRKAPRENGFFQSSLFKTLFWILLIGGFISLIIWFLYSSNIRLFKSGPRSIDTAGSEELESQDIFSINFEYEINKAVNAGNYRLAVRLMYLQILKELSQRNIIKYSHEKTNRDYLFQLNKTRYYKNFFTLTRHFNYTWYGHFSLSPEVFEQVQKDFSSFKQQMA